MKVYKLVKIKKDGNCYPLFIDKSRAFKFGEWMQCEFHPTTGFAERSITDDEKIGGWHCCFQPVAWHLSEQLANGEKRVWIECDSKGRTKKYNRPESQGGTWLLVEYIKPLRILTSTEVKVMRDIYISERVNELLKDASRMGLRCCPIDDVYKDSVIEIYEINKDSSYYLTTDKNGQLWLNWE